MLDIFYVCVCKCVTDSEIELNCWVCYGYPNGRFYDLVSRGLLSRLICHLSILYGDSVMLAFILGRNVGLGCI